MTSVSEQVQVCYGIVYNSRSSRFHFRKRVGLSLKTRRIWNRRIPNKSVRIGGEKGSRRKLAPGSPGGFLPGTPRTSPDRGGGAAWGVLLAGVLRFVSLGN